MTISCPDWAALVRERERAERSPDVGAAAIDRVWEDALSHRADCERCRTVSLRIDPLLLFSANLAAARGRTGRPDDANGVDNADRMNHADDMNEVDELRKRVRLELDGRATKKRLDAARTARRRMPVASALAAGVAAAAFGLGFLFWPKTAPPPSDVADAELSLPAHVAMAPLVEPLGDEPMRVFQLPGDGLASSLDVVLVVTEIAP